MVHIGEPMNRTPSSFSGYSNPAVVEFTRRALIYLQTAASEPKSLDPTG